MPKNVRKQVGVVGVDSGQVLLVDPCYVESLWTKEGVPNRVEFWGRDQNQVEAELKRVYPRMRSYRAGSDATVIPLSSKLTVNEVASRIAQAQQTLNLVGGLMYVAKGDGSYNECCAQTLGTNGAGPVMEGAATVSCTGWGDGVYPVLADYGSDGRIRRLTIEFMED